MGRAPGPRPPELSELIRAEERLSFLYAEQAHIHRDGNAVTITDRDGTLHLPAAGLGVLLLGPGTTVTQQAMVTIAESGSTVVWVGERGVRYYAHGRSLSRSSRLIEAQARVFANQRLRLRVARRMYEMRFPGEDVSGATMQQLRGREGARVRRVYRDHSNRTGVPWQRRDYQLDDFEASDPINLALSAANVCLYGVVHAVIVAIGCSPSLGIVHTGEARSFVYDIADLYKTELCVPAAFDAVAQGESDDLERDVRRALRDRFVDGALMRRCVRDIRELLAYGLSGERGQAEDAATDGVGDDGPSLLWDGGTGVVHGGTSYGAELDDFDTIFDDPAASDYGDAAAGGLGAEGGLGAADGAGGSV